MATLVLAFSQRYNFVSRANREIVAIGIRSCDLVHALRSYDGAVAQYNTNDNSTSNLIAEHCNSWHKNICMTRIVHFMSIYYHV
jgi:hypothetical protein